MADAKSVEDAPEAMPEWFKAVDVIRAEVQFTEHDSATLLALPQSELLKQLPKFQALVGKFESDDGMTKDEVKELIASQDNLLSPMIEAWSMEDHAEAFKVPFPVPSTLSPEDRLGLYNALPFPTIKRLMKAAMLHLGNA